MDPARSERGSISSGCVTLSGMPKFDVVALLRMQHREATATVDRLDEAIRVLERLGGKGSVRSGSRTISAAGRKRIATAQRKRWAKLRLVKKK